jgi:hypothetical protein
MVRKTMTAHAAAARTQIRKEATVTAINFLRKR